MKKILIQLDSDPQPSVFDRVVAIDAGHGGEDPGALGHRRLREKTVVLQIAKRLARLIDAESGMRAYLVRNGDYFISLRDRFKKARDQKADLFISIHADAFRDRRARGSSDSRRSAPCEAAAPIPARATCGAAASRSSTPG